MIIEVPPAYVCSTCHHEYRHHSKMDKTEWCGVPRCACPHFESTSVA